MLYLVNALWFFSLVCFGLAAILAINRSALLTREDRKAYLRIGRKAKGYTTFPMLASIMFYAGLCLLVYTVCVKFNVSLSDALSLFRSLVRFPF